MTTWLTPSEAARRLGIGLDRLERLAAAGMVRRSSIAGDHQSIDAASVDAYLAKRDRPVPVGEGPEIGDEAEQQYREEKGT